MAAFQTQAQHARMMQMVSRPTSFRPLSSATSIDATSDNEEPKRRTGHWQGRKQSMLRRTTHEDEVSEAESFESLTSRAKAMEHMLSDSDSSIDSRRFSTDNHSMTTISSEGPGTPRSPAPEYSVEFPDNMAEYINEKAAYRSMSMNDTPGFAEQVKEMTTVGPVGPHLFRSYSTSHVASVPAINIPLPVSAMPPSPPQSHGSHHSPEIGVYGAPTPPSDSEPIVFPRQESAQVNVEEVRLWSTEQVCEWMVAMGFEIELVQKFHANDISGAILVDLKWNDLKELNITSFGKRIELWTEIHHLIARDVPAPMSPDTAFVRPSSRLSRHSSNRSPISPARGRSGSDASIHSQTMVVRHTPEPEMVQRRPAMISEEETDIERSRERSGARSRHQVRRKSKRANVRIPRRQISVDSIIITSEDGTDFEEGFVVRPRRQRSVRPDASADAHGRKHKTHKHKHHKEDGETRRHKCSKGERCPKHNKRIRRAEQQQPEPQDLSPIHGTILIAATPSIADGLDYEARRQSILSSNSILASSDVLGPILGREVRLQESALREISRIDPLENVKAFLSLQEVQYSQESRDSAPPVPEKSPGLVQRNFLSTPSPPMVRSHTAPLRPSTPPEIQAPPRGQTPAFGLRSAGLEQAQPPASMQSSPPRLRTPANVMRTTTPFSEADVPVHTASPVYVREQSSSVPPDLHYRQRYPTPTMESLVNGRRPARVAPLNVVDENAEWEALDEDVKMAPSPSTRTHSGWMKKRRTNWFRHEWPDYHFVLRGTHLGYSKDVATAELGHINMDDFQVACTNSNSTKLAAAFKAHRIFGRKKDDVHANSYFFQLVPANEQGAKAKKNLGKAHFFAVGTREERIDWMRELMLAKAIKAKNEGFSVEVNGERV